MIRKVLIRRFRRVRDVTLELGRLNVFIGANGVGKTSLMEAIALLGAAAGGRVDAGELRARGGRPKWHRQMSSIEAWSDGASYRAELRNPSGSGWWEFVGERMAEGEVELATREHGSGVVLLDRESKEYLAMTLGPTEGLAPGVRPFLGKGPAMELLLELERFVLYSPSPDVMAGRVADPTRVRPLGVAGGGLDAALADAARDRVLWERLCAEAGSFWTGGAEGLTSAAAGDRARFVVFLFLLLLHRMAPPVLALKNPDAALSPRLAFRVMERVRKLVLDEPERPQILLATQRPEVLDALDLRDDRCRLFVVCRGRRGETLVRRVELDEGTLARLEKLGGALSELWRRGWWGGMPIR